MSDRDRHRLFLAATLVLATTGALILVLVGGWANRAQDSRGGKESAGARRVVLAPRAGSRRQAPRGAVAPVPSVSPHRGEDLPVGVRPRPGARVDPRARRTAVRFVRALLHVETGASSPAHRQALVRSATPALARRALGSPVRAPAGTAAPARGALVALQPLRDADGGLAFVATTGRAGRRTGLVLSMTGGEKRWRVGGLR